MLRLSALYRYPLKSGKAEALQQIGLDKLGLEGDRRWMLVDEASGRFLTQRAVAKMSQLTALWNTAGGLTLSSPGHGTLDVALPGADALRGVTIWHDTLRVPDAGDAAAAWSAPSSVNRRAWCICPWIAHASPSMVLAMIAIRSALPTVTPCC